ncbi:glycosyltransferase [soil metagenome]
MTICFTVTNDLTFDQRMIRICSSLAGAGYQVSLIGRKLKHSLPLQRQPFHQKRISCFFNKGIIFYAEYNFRLFCYLLKKKSDCLCAIDLDTILPVFFCSRLRRTKRVYDAHELFCEMKEIASRPRIHQTWKRIEEYTVPKFEYGYTVNKPIAQEFYTLYGREYKVIRNLPSKSHMPFAKKNQKLILYQGAVNEGRSFETLIPAFKEIEAVLWVIGVGNFYMQAKALVKKYQLEDKVHFKGTVQPEDLPSITRQAKIGVTLFDSIGLSNYYSLANRFFDYVEAGTPQLCINYPAYAEVNRKYEVALLIDDLSPENIAKKLNQLLQDQQLYERLQKNCMNAREELNWENEQEKVIGFYDQIFNR